MIVFFINLEAGIFSVFENVTYKLFDTSEKVSGWVKVPRASLINAKKLKQKTPSNLDGAFIV